MEMRNAAGVMKAAGGGVSAALALGLALVACAIVWPELAIAQPPPPPNPTDIIRPSDLSFARDDVAKAMLERILGVGDISNLNSSSGRSLLGELFYYMNGAALLFGALMFTYVSVMSVLRTAEDGELMGKGWSSVWIPIRFVAGVSMLFPTATGFSLIQVVVITIAVWGVQVGNLVAYKAMSAYTNNTEQLVSSNFDHTGEGLNVTWAILKAEACVASHNYTETGDPTRGPYGVSVARGNNALGLDAKVVWGWAQPGPPGDDVAKCGSITIPRWTPVTVDSRGAAMVNAIADAKLNAILNLQIAVSQFARTAIVSYDNGSGQAGQAASYEQFRNAFMQILTQYNTSVAQEITAQANPQALAEYMRPMTQGVIEDINKKGFIALGPWFYQLGRMNSEINSALNQRVEIKEVKLERLASGGVGTNGLAESLSFVDERVLAVLEELENNLDGVASTPGMPAPVDAGLSQSRSAIVGWVRTKTNAVTGDIGQSIGELIVIDPGRSFNDTPHSLVQLKTTGDSLINAGWVLVGMWAGGKAIGAICESFPGTKVACAAQSAGTKVAGTLAKYSTGAFGQFIAKLGEALGLGDGKISSITAMILVALVVSVFSLAVTLAFWIPLAPFVIWLGGILAWLIAVLEFVASAPLWAAAHLHPEGEGFAGRYGSTGYMIAAEVFAKPVLMVAGFLIAFATIDPFLKIISGFFRNAWGAINADTVTGLVTLIAYIVIYVLVCLTMVTKIFALIHLIPSSVLGIIGARNPNFDQSEAISERISNNIVNVVAYSRTTAAALGQGVRRMGGGGERAATRGRGGDVPEGFGGR